ncbi:alpha/beta hydrolase [Donghicola sp. C2-DW-16]|uniref:Alpha/beta hydrolase n=1 Tax=Donghicola mangrovi TaxID=2729614 RepID=A0ABX2PHA7_9RHOB|nr:alpha/beta hydrolase [Donghicola mangrovi]NVO28883.1 alpha/beta hydrolase [Donghicola mangrovi]
MIWTTRPRSRVEELAAITCGTGPLVILLHGVGLRAEAWGAQIDALSGRYGIMAPDMAGHGDSTLFEAPPALADYTDRVAAALDRPAIVVGHSMGSMIALDLAARYPDRVLAVAALNAIFRRTEAAKAAVLARAASLDGETVADPEPPLVRWFGNSPSPERAACGNWLRSADPRGYRDAYKVFASCDGPDDDALSGLPCPALFMTGAEEPNSTPEMSQQMAALVPDGAALVLPNAAHMMPMTHAAQVNAALEQFIERCLK